MIDHDFIPDRTQLEALGHLFVHVQNYPSWPSLRIAELYDKMSLVELGDTRASWLNELEGHGLAHIEIDDIRADEAGGADPYNVCLTPAGVYYLVSRASLLAENSRGLTRDLPQEIVDAPWPIQAYFSLLPDQIAPSSDRFVRFDHNEEAYDAALVAIDDVLDAVRSDNELSAQQRGLRDRKLEELTAIRTLLESREGWSSKLMAAGWGALGYLIAQFANHPIGYAADKAWHALQVVIGLH